MSIQKLKFKTNIFRIEKKITHILAMQCGIGKKPIFEFHLSPFTRIIVMIPAKGITVQWLSMLAVKSGSLGSNHSFTL